MTRPHPHRQIRNTLAATLLLLTAAIRTVNAADSESADGWSYAVSPYLWFPSVSSTVRYPLALGTGGTFDVEVGADDYLDNLEFAFMVGGEARKGSWALMTDVIYLNFSLDKSAVRSINFGAGRVPVSGSLDAGTESSLEGWVWTLLGGYSFMRSEKGFLDGVAGFRFLTLEATTDWRLTATVTGPGGSQTFPASGSVSDREDYWDAVAGLRGRARLGGGNWFAPYYVDVGAGSSDLTWQGVLGLAYGFTSIDVYGVYRHLGYQAGGSSLVDDMNVSGPALGAAFRF